MWDGWNHITMLPMGLFVVMLLFLFICLLFGIVSSGVGSSDIPTFSLVTMIVVYTFPIDVTRPGNTGACIILPFRWCFHSKTLPNL